ncbi:Dabb family protein [Oryzomonas japonica]|uniref:Dabb family protein n=2 Tax=Oryzomonas TaxID=2855184 RepID=A0A5A9XFW1_9BACT|nr:MULTISPECIES: Dabb family protein [Oryzomonas]KAA0891345.1 Dabb family protein [Oryzomonas rubra]KAB0664468.1 Dabb family protein [Oryzomonas japonica]
MITHIIFFKLSDASPENLAVTQGKLLSMQGKIPQLRHLEAGIDIIRSERSYDIALVTKFDSLDDMQAYQIHPYHAGEVLPHMRSVCSSIVAVDYQD